MAPIINVSDEVLKTLNPQVYTRRTDLEVTATATQPVETQEPSEFNYEVNPSDYIFVSGIKSGPEKRPDLWVCKYKLGMSPEVEQAGKTLGLGLDNTAREESSGNEYIGRIQRVPAIKLNLLLGGRTADVRLERDFLKLLYSGDAMDGNGKQVKKSELLKILGEITEVKKPWRSEWLEDAYTGRQGALVLEKHYALENDVLILQYSKKFTACLMKDRMPGINLQNWLTDSKKSTAQGYPKANVGDGDFWYWNPKPGMAVGCGTDSVSAGLYCSGNPLGSDLWLGVRYVREVRNFSKK